MYLLDVGRCKLPAIWYCQCCRDPDTCVVGCLSARVPHLPWWQMEHLMTAFSSGLLDGGHGVTKRTSVFNCSAYTAWVSIVGSLRDREVACSASDRQGSNFESCVWRTVSSQSSHHPQEVLLAQFSLYVHKGGLKPDSFHLYSLTWVHILKSVER